MTKKPINRWFCRFLIALLLAASLGIAQADSVILVNGDRFSGRLLEREGKKMVFQSEYAGKLRIRWEYVANLVVDKPANLLFDTGDEISVYSVEIGDEKITYRSADDHKIYTMDAYGIVGANPRAWINNQEGLWEGRANIALKSDRGNGDAEFADLDFDIQYRRISDRYRFYGEWEHDIKIKDDKSEQVSKNEWLASGSYDYFLGKKNYVSALMIAEADALSNLELRTTLGPLYGYQFYESKPLNLLAEVGLLWIDENYENPENDDAFLQPAWHLIFDKYFYDNKMQFYHEQYGSISVNSSDRWLIRSWTGFRIPTRSALGFSIEYKIEYDSDPIINNDSTESTFRLKIGYDW